MGFLPQVNATVVSITRGGQSEDYDRPEVNSAPIWQGTEDAYVQNKFVSTFNGNELVRVEQVTLFLSEDFPETIEPGDIITYTAGDSLSPVTSAGRAQNSVDPAYLPQLSDYYKVALEAVNVP